MGKVEMARFTGSDIWLSKCEDISYFNGKVTCLRKSAKQACGLELIFNGITADSLKLDSCIFLNEESVALWMGRYANIDVYHDSWETHRIIRSQRIKTLDGIRFEPDYPPVWEGYSNNFIDSLQQEIRYTDADFFILNGVGL